MEEIDRQKKGEEREKSNNKGWRKRKSEGEKGRIWPELAFAERPRRFKAYCSNAIYAVPLCNIFFPEIN